LHKETITTAGIVVAAMTAGVLLLTVISGFLDVASGLEFIVAPAVLLGLLSPVVGYRLYCRMRERLPREADDAYRCRRFLAATIIAAGISESIAILGIAAFLLSGSFAGLVGVVTHVILVGAIWPSQEKLAAFLHRDRN
jgi:hypothetical protein